MLNKVILIGRLGADPEVRQMPNGDAITTIRLATSRNWKDRNTGERKEETEWHRVVFFSGLAKVAGDYLRKGSQAYVEGRIRTQQWQGQDGQDRYTTEIVADEMRMLDGKNSGGASPSNDGMPNQAPSYPSYQSNQPSNQPSTQAPAMPQEDWDDVPF